MVKDMKKYEAKTLDDALKLACEDLNVSVE